MLGNNSVPIFNKIAKYKSSRYKFYNCPLSETIILILARYIFPLNCKYFLFLFLYMCLHTKLHAQFNELSSLRSKKIAIVADTLRIDTLSIMPGSFFVKGYDSSQYYIDVVKSQLVWKVKPDVDSIQISYRVFPILFGQKYFHKDVRLVDKNLSVTPFYYDAVEANSKQPFIDFGSMDYSGSFGRALSFGNSQDVVLNSQFNLQLDGDLGDSIHVIGVVTDNTIPFQPEGNTQQIQEFDRVFIQLKRKQTSLIMGDYDIKKPAGYFMNFYKRVQGVYFASQIHAPNKSLNSIALGASLAKGKFARNTLIALEGNQGPYKLTGSNGEQFFVVLAGTEKVYIDGQLQKRGEDLDYIIDYNTAEITFMPRRIITKDLRLVVEFEYSDKNYINSLFYFHDELQVSKKWQCRFNVYANQDAKNQSIQQNLDSSQKHFLAQLGDSIQLAYYPNIRMEDTFSNQKILYKKIDTTVNGVLYQNVFVFSTNADSAKYSLGFSVLGTNKGNYRQSINSANGRVYQWVPPIGNIPQGDYEPISILITPKKQQLITIGTTYQIDSSKSFMMETAMSNNDPNTFSAKDNETHQGIATKLVYNENRCLNKKREINLASHVDYEFVQDRFIPIERFRNIEFARDWNITTTEKKENENLGSIAFTLQKANIGQIHYSFGSYIRGTSFKGTQQIISLSARQNGFQFHMKGDVMKQNSTTLKSNYYRPQMDLEKQFKKLDLLTIGTKFIFEQNELKNANTDTLLKSAFSFDATSLYIKNNAASKTNFSADYTVRHDRAVQQNKFTPSTLGRTFTLNVNSLSFKNQEIHLTSAYRILSITDTLLTTQKPDESLLGRLEYNFSAAQGLFSGNALYEIGSGQEAKREFAYILVPAGQGQYVWRDYNRDNFPQLNEFELAIFPDEKLYIKIYTPTNKYVKAKYAQYNQSVSFNPKAWITNPNAKGLKKIIASLFVQSSIQLNNRFLGKEGLSQYNPFLQKFEDSLLINNTSTVNNSISINRFSNLWGFDYIQTISGGKVLLNYGIDSRKNKSHQFRLRYNVLQQLTLQMVEEFGNKEFSSNFLENKSYQINYQTVEPSLTYQCYHNQLRLQGLYKYNIRKNEINLGGEKALIHSVHVDIKYNLVSAGSIQLKSTFSEIDFNGISNSGIGYTMLNGLQNGKNWQWQGSFDKRISRNIEMSIEYEGRKSATTGVIHTGRASVRAIF